MISACVVEPDTQSCLRLIACTVAPASCPVPCRRMSSVALPNRYWTSARSADRRARRART
eukprot:scaffold8186_cov59-Phaeocystis_antarctica.AAC.2